MNNIALNQLPKTILTELEERQRLIITATEDAKTIIGQQLKSANNLLSRNGYGCYGEWLDFIGMNRQTANRYIQRYDAIVTNCDNQEFKELPDSLIYEYSKPSARPELKQAIEDGDIKTHKAFKEMEQKLKEAEDKTRRYEEVSKNLTDQRDGLVRELQNVKPEVVVKEIVKEVVKVPDDYENLKRQAEFYRKASGESSKAYENILSENMALRQQTKEKTYYKGLDIGVFVAYLREFISNMKKYEAFKDDFKNLTLEDERTIEMWINRTRDQLTVMEMLKNNMEVTIIE